MRGRKRATISATTGSSTAWRAGSGSGQAITLRTTSPHAASVVSSEALMPATSSAQLGLVDDVELHALPGGEAQLLVGELGHPVEGQPLLGLMTPPGTEARTMHE